MKIKFQDIVFKNLFSYGDIENKIVFNKGINLLTSVNDQRSNGVGKSSALMSLPFCLFGKTAKKVNQSDLINWKNGKKCFAELNLVLDTNNLKIQRSLKPNFLNIFINDSALPKDSSITITQKKLEEMLKWDLRIFNNLIYCSNSTISLIEASTEEKRKFLENLFNIEFISIINEKIAKKITIINNKKNSLNGNLKIYEEDYKKLKTKLKNYSEEIDIRKYEEDYKNSKSFLTKISEESEIIPEKKIIIYNNIIEKLIKCKEKYEKYNSDLKEKYNTINNTLNFKNKELIKIKNNFCGEEKINFYKNKFKELDVYDDSNIDILEKNKQELIEKENELNSTIKNHKFIEKEYHKELNKILNDFEEVTQCPTCGSETNKSNILEYQNQKKTEILKNIEINQGLIDSVEKDKLSVSNNIKEINKEISNIKNLIKEKNDIEKLIEYNEEKIISIKELENEISIEEKKLEEYENKFKYELVDKINNKIDDLKNRLKTNNKIIEKIDNLKKEVHFKEELYNNKINELENQKNIIKDIENDVKSKEEKIKEIKKELNNLNKSFDYLSYIKEGCHDKKIKKWIINDSMPYINERANYYLSSLGIQYYLEISGFLDVKINGVGVSDVNIRNLSSGEMKSVNMAIAFALMDVSQIRNNSHVDLLILDEILDGAVDEDGIEQLMNLIKIRQQDLDLKVFITSHRKEIQDFDIDYLYEIKKINGFSEINQKF